MLSRLPYSPRELRVVETIPGPRPVEIKDTPVTPRQNMMSLFWEKKPYWMPLSSDIKTIRDPWNMHMGRGTSGDMTDCFGIEWVWEPTAGGCIVRGDRPQLLEDVNDWKEKVILPDIDTWDWAGIAERTPIDRRFSLQLSFTNGFWFERLISFMGFVPAACALIDEDQQDAIRELFGALTDLGCRIVDRFCEYFPAVDTFYVHDDWGSQMAPFFSEEIARDLFLPYMKQLTGRIHANGRVASLHSCGHNESRIELFIEAGFDEWTPQDMNNVKELYEKYGDRIVFGVFPERTDIASLTEEEQRAEARKFVDFYNQPGKPSTMGVSTTRRATPAFMEEVYAYSRQLYFERG